MSRVRRLALCMIVLVIGCASTALVMSLADPAHSALTVHIGYFSGLSMSAALAVGLFIALTLQTRERMSR